MAVCLAGLPQCGDGPMRGPVGMHDQPIEPFAGGRVQLVWSQPLGGEGADPFATSDRLLLMGVDTRDGRGERRILEKAGNYSRPLLSPDGLSIFYTDKGVRRDAAERWTLNLAGAPEIKGGEVYHPRWSNHARFIVMTDTYHVTDADGESGSVIFNGGAHAQVVVARLSEYARTVEAWQTDSLGAGGEKKRLAASVHDPRGPYDDEVEPSPAHSIRSFNQVPGPPELTVWVTSLQLSTAGRWICFISTAIAAVQTPLTLE